MHHKKNFWINSVSPPSWTFPKQSHQPSLTVTNTKTLQSTTTHVKISRHISTKLLISSKRSTHVAVVSWYTVMLVSHDQQQFASLIWWDNEVSHLMKLTNTLKRGDQLFHLTSTFLDNYWLSNANWMNNAKWPTITTTITHALPAHVVFHPSWQLTSAKMDRWQVNNSKKTLNISLIHLCRKHVWVSLTTQNFLLQTLPWWLHHKHFHYCR